jgi:hypothetical protein
MAERLTTQNTKELREFFFYYTPEEAKAELDRWLEEANPEDPELIHLNRMIKKLIDVSSSIHENL